MAQFGRLLGAHIGRKGAVGSVKHMMPLIKHIACRAALIISASIGSLNHYQRMVGHDNVCSPRPPHRFFNKAFIVMGAGRMDTFPPPVCQPRGLAAAKQIHQPSRKAGAGQVAISAGPGPSCH